MNTLGQTMKAEFALQAKPTDGQTDGQMDGRISFFFQKVWI